MKRYIILALTLFATTLLPSGFAINEQGTKAISMGNAFSAVSDDPTALFYNPAGITNLKNKININTGISLFIPKTEFKSSQTSNITETNSSYPVLPQLNFAYAVTPELYLGFGISSPYSAKIEWPDKWEGADHVEMMGLTSIDISPSVAYEIIKGLSVALTYDLGLAGVELRKRVALSSTDYMLVKMASSEIATAHGFKASALYRYKAFAVSAVFKYGKTYNFKGNASFTASSPVFTTLIPSDQKMKLSLTLPHEVILGVSYQIIPQKLLFSFDYQYTKWSSYKELKFEFEKNEFDKDENGNKTKYSTIPKNWKDASAFRFGLEYKHKDFSFRGGYVYDFNPVPDETLDPSLPDNDRNIFSLGLGYALSKNINFDFAYSFVLFKERISDNDPKGSYKTNVSIISFSSNFYF